MAKRKEVPEGMLAQTKKDIKACQKRLETAAEKLKSLIAEGTAKKDALDSAQEKARRLAHEYGELERRETQVVQLTADLEEAKAGQEDPEITAKREQLDALTKNINAVEATIAQVKQHKAAATTWKGNQERLKDMRSEVVALAVQEDACRPAGLPKALFEEVRGKVETEMNWWVSEGLLPWQITIDTEFEIHTPHGPLFTATPSEKFRVGLALGATLSVASGLKFLVVDELERLTMDFRPVVIGCLVKLLTRLDQVLVTMAIHKRPAKGASEPIQTFWVGGNGTVEAVEE